MRNTRNWCDDMVLADGDERRAAAQKRAWERHVERIRDERGESLALGMGQLTPPVCEPGGWQKEITLLADARKRGIERRRAHESSDAVRLCREERAKRGKASAPVKPVVGTWDPLHVGRRPECIDAEYWGIEPYTFDEHMLVDFENEWKRTSEVYAILG